MARRPKMFFEAHFPTGFQLHRRRASGRKATAVFALPARPAHLPRPRCGAAMHAHRSLARLFA